jgi:DNA-3-methyladenine glycosylase I
MRTEWGFERVRYSRTQYAHAVLVYNWNVSFQMVYTHESYLSIFIVRHRMENSRRKCHPVNEMMNNPVPNISILLQSIISPSQHAIIVIIFVQCTIRMYIYYTCISVCLCVCSMQRGDDSMFEKLCLEGAQSGLSWLTILRKRTAYRKTFHNFNIDLVAAMTEKDIQAIIDTPTTTTTTKRGQGGGKASKKIGGENNTRHVVVRHRGKIEAVINNAKCIQQMRILKRTGGTTDEFDRGEHGVFDTFLWNFVQDKPILNNWWDGENQLSDAPGRSIESDTMSKELKKLGFKFVGPTMCYSMMQSEGMVIDHPVNSPEWISAMERLKERPGGYQTRDKKP